MARPLVAGTFSSPPVRVHVYEKPGRYMPMGADGSGCWSDPDHRVLLDSEKEVRAVLEAHGYTLLNDMSVMKNDDPALAGRLRAQSDEPAQAPTKLEDADEVQQQPPLPVWPQAQGLATDPPVLREEGEDTTSASIDPFADAPPPVSENERAAPGTYEGEGGETQMGGLAADPPENAEQPAALAEPISEVDEPPAAKPDDAEWPAEAHPDKIEEPEPEPEEPKGKHKGKTGRR